MGWGEGVELFPWPRVDPGEHLVLLSMKIHRQAVFQNSLVTVEVGKMISPLSANPNQYEGSGVASERQPWAYGHDPVRQLG